MAEIKPPVFKPFRGKSCLPVTLTFFVFIIIITSASANEWLYLHFLSVGYGDSIVIELPENKTILIDAGGVQEGEAVNQFFKKRNIQKIHIAIITHPHDNHFGGFFWVLKKFPIEKIFYNGDDKGAEQGFDELKDVLKTRRLPLSVLKREDTIQTASAKITIKVLHPGSLDASTNGNSLVTWIVYENTSFLLTADIEPRQQKALMELYPEIQKANVIQVPHHGGKISQKFADFLNADDKKLYIVSTGQNEKGKPWEEELKKLDGNVLRTDLDGHITVKSDGSQIIIE